VHIGWNPQPRVSVATAVLPPCQPFVAAWPGLTPPGCKCQRPLRGRSSAAEHSPGRGLLPCRNHHKMGTCCTALSPILPPPVPLYSLQVSGVTRSLALCGGNVVGLVPVPCGFAACTDFPRAFKPPRDCFQKQSTRANYSIIRDAARLESLPASELPAIWALQTFFFRSNLSACGKTLASARISSSWSRSDYVEPCL
jgi:hypothetical protein